MNMPHCKHLLVDGWNVIHADGDLRRVFDGGKGMRAAQDLLAKKLSFIHDSGGIRITIIYDGKGESISVESIGRQATFAEVYTPSSMTADELIEHFCAHSKHPQDLLVASADNMIRLTSGGFEVGSISPETLFGWARGSAAFVDHFCEANSDMNARKWLRQKMSDGPFSGLDELAEELRAVERAMEEIKNAERRRRKSGLRTPEDKKNGLMRRPVKAAQRTTLKDLSSLGDAFFNPKRTRAKR